MKICQIIEFLRQIILVRDNPIFSNYFKNFKICVLKKAGDVGKEMSLLEKAKTTVGFKVEDLGSLDDQDYNKKLN